MKAGRLAQARLCRYFVQTEPKMVVLGDPERSVLKVREHRKRRMQAGMSGIAA